MRRSPKTRASRKPTTTPSDSPPRKKRPNYHKLCEEKRHDKFGKQRKSCPKCVVEMFNRCVKAGMSREQTLQAVLSVSKTYRCPFCIKDAIFSSSFGEHTLKLFRSCCKHRAPPPRPATTLPADELAVAAVAGDSEDGCSCDDAPVLDADGLDSSRSSDDAAVAADACFAAEASDAYLDGLADP